MQHVYIVTNDTGHIFGVYADYETAREVFAALAENHAELQLRTERLLTRAAHYPLTTA